MGVFVCLTFARGNLQTVKKRERKKKPETISGILRRIETVERPSLL